MNHGRGLLRKRGIRENTLKQDSSQNTFSHSNGFQDHDSNHSKASNKNYEDYFKEKVFYQTGYFGNNQVNSGYSGGHQNPQHNAGGYLGSRHHDKRNIQGYRGGHSGNVNQVVPRGGHNGYQPNQSYNNENYRSHGSGSYNSRGSYQSNYQNGHYDYPSHDSGYHYHDKGNYNKSYYNKNRFHKPTVHTDGNRQPHSNSGRAPSNVPTVNKKPSFSNDGSNIQVTVNALMVRSVTNVERKSPVKGNKSVFTGNKSKSVENLNTDKTLATEGKKPEKNAQVTNVDKKSSVTGKNSQVTRKNTQSTESPNTAKAIVTAETKLQVSGNKSLTSNVNKKPVIWKDSRNDVKSVDKESLVMGKNEQTTQNLNVATAANADNSNKAVESMKNSNNEKPRKGARGPTAKGKFKAEKKKFVKNHAHLHSDVTINIDTSLPFASQCDSVINQLSLSENRLLSIEAVRKDVENAFQSGIENVRAVIFGSTLAGTAFGNSDVDIFLESSEILTIPQVAPHIKNMQSSKLFKNVVKIFGARVPIIRATNVRTQIAVDISFTAPYGVSNSHLIKKICSHNPRVKHFIMILLLWAKKHNFVSTQLMSPFTLIVLAIFYLQTIGVLPPLYKLLENDGKLPWPTVISDRLPELLVTSNTDDLFTLLSGFYSFYSAINFDQVVISPFAGELILTAYFKQQANLPDEPEGVYPLEKNLPKCFSNYLELVQSGKEKRMQVTKCTVQEPTTLNVNITRHLGEAEIEIFKKGCLSALEVLNKVSQEYGLVSILSNYCALVSYESTAKWVLNCPETSLREEWFQKVHEVTLYIFTKILLMTVSPITDDSSYKLDITYSSGNGLIICYNVTSHYDVFSPKREKMLKTVTGTELEREEAVSKRFQSKISRATEFNFSATVCLLSNFVNRSVDVKLISNGKRNHDGHFTKVVSFLMGGKMKNYVALLVEANSNP